MISLRNKKIKYVIVIFLVIFAIFYVFNSPTVFTSQEKIKITNHQDFVITTGTIRGREDVFLSFQQSGTVKSIPVSVGDVVEEGALVASLDASSFEAEIHSQQFSLAEELARLNRYLYGPEPQEEREILAKLRVSEKELEGSLYVALTQAQQTAVEIENTVRKDIDKYFDGVPGSLRYIGKARLPNINEIIAQRNKAEEVFVGWHDWITITKFSPSITVEVLKNFLRDLYILQTVVQEVYEEAVEYRVVNDENEELFDAVAELRLGIQKAIVVTAESYSRIQNNIAKTTLNQSQTQTELAGGTKLSRAIQNTAVSKAREELRLRQIKLEEAQLIAPFTGKVGQILIDESEYVNAGSDAVRIVSDGGFEITADITEAEVRYVSVGDTVRANIDVTDEDVVVRIRNIDQTERDEQGVPVYMVVFDVVSEDIIIRPGMTVNLYIPFGEKRDVWEIPRDAIQRDRNGSFITIEREGKRIDMPITIDATLFNDSVGVTGELQEGDIVLYGTE